MQALRKAVLTDATVAGEGEAYHRIEAVVRKRESIDRHTSEPNVLEIMVLTGSGEHCPTGIDCLHEAHPRGEKTCPAPGSTPHVQHEMVPPLGKVHYVEILLANVLYLSFVEFRELLPFLPERIDGSRIQILSF